MTEEQEKLQLLAKFYTELAENQNGFMCTIGVSGRLLQQHNYPHLYGPHTGMSLNKIKTFKVNPPKPKVQKIVLSACIESGIDMEFGEGRHDHYLVSKLMRIEDCSTHKKYHCKHYDTTDSYYDCRVRQGPFIHFNKSYDYCPIPEGLEVKLYYRNGDTDIRDYYGTIRYTLIGDQDDIIGWEVIGTADNYEY